MINLRLAEEAHDRNQLERDLRGALSHGDLGVAYQPIVRSTDGFVTGVEALLRWTHPSRGEVAAITAVTIAEQSGLIAGVGAWVARGLIAPSESRLRRSVPSMSSMTR